VTEFIVIGAGLLSVALAFLAVPLMQDRSRRGFLTAVMAAVVLIGASAGLYWKLGNHEWSNPVAAEAGAPHSIEEMVSRLEAKLAKSPDDVDGWLMLGRSYAYRTDFPRAVQAFEHAYNASKGQNTEAIASYAEALAISDPTALAGKAGELFETALQMDPKNQKALWYGGMAQANKGNFSVAHDRWMALIQQDLPPEVRPQLAARIRELNQASGRKADPELDRISPPGEKPVAPALAAQDEPSAAAAKAPSGSSIRIRVDVAPGMKGKVPPGALLFVLARDPTHPGPPLAAKRVVGATLPLEVDLSDQDAGMSGRALKDAPQLVIVARFSASGQPQQGSGDVYGQATVATGTKSVHITIDQRVP